MSQVQQGFERLKLALDVFQNALDAPPLATLRPTFESTTSSDLNAFLRQRDESSHISPSFTVKLSQVKMILDFTYNTGWKTYRLEETALQQLYGCLKCALLAGHNIHKDMPKIVSLLEQTGECIQPRIIEDIEEQISEPLWVCVCVISMEIIRLCTIYASQGVSPAENRACSMTWNQIRAAQNEYRVTQSQNLLRLRVSQEKLDRIKLWLSPLDQSSNFNAALKDRQADTGLWLLRRSQFMKWKTTNNALLWLYGKPGCGKTILTSTVIENMTTHIQALPNQAVAYFFFTFRDEEKQGSRNMVTSIISQLSSQSTTPTAIEELFSTCRNGQRQPSFVELMEVLRQLIYGFNETFIVLDALDECEDAAGRKDRTDILQCLREILGWKLGTLHVIVTSRPEKEIEDFLHPLLNSDGKISIQSALVHDDIHAYVRHEIQNRHKLARRWGKQPKVQEEIESKLMEGVDGMFRWAVCQLDALESCLNLNMLRTALKNLPHGLDDTYARILRNIKPEYRSYAVKMLQWLVLSARPLRIEEMVEILAIETDPEPRFDPENRFPDQGDVLAICSSLLTTVSAIHNVAGFGRRNVEEIALAHFSVKEYLISSRVCKDIEIFRVQIIPGNKVITEMSLAYLLQFDKAIDFTRKVLEEFPLARYSAQHWMQHARIIDREQHLPVQHAMGLFSSEGYCFINWRCLYNPDNAWDNDIRLSKEVRDAVTPLYYASLVGIYSLVVELLQREADVNAQGGLYGNALQAASAGGHEAIVKLLLDKKADVNAQGGHYGNALQAASAGGHEAIVKLLLDKKAEVNAQGGHYGNALQAASANGHEVIIKLLLDKKADVNAQGGYYGNALQAASAGGHEAIVKLLLDKKAEVNAQGGVYGNALQAASAGGHKAIVKLLLDKKAEVNAQGGVYGNALQAASARGHEAVVTLLRQAEADMETSSESS